MISDSLSPCKYDSEPLDPQSIANTTRMERQFAPGEDLAEESVALSMKKELDLQLLSDSCTIAYGEYAMLHRRLNRILGILKKYLRLGGWNERLYSQYMGSRKDCSDAVDTFCTAYEALKQHLEVTHPLPPFRVPSDRLLLDEEPFPHQEVENQRNMTHFVQACTTISRVNLLGLRSRYTHATNARNIHSELKIHYTAKRRLFLTHGGARAHLWSPKFDDELKWVTEEEGRYAKELDIARGLFREGVASQNGR